MSKPKNNENSTSVSFDNNTYDYGDTSPYTVKYKLPEQEIEDTVTDLREKIEERKQLVLKRIIKMIELDIEEESEAVSIISELVNKFKIDPKTLESRIVIRKL